MKPQHIILFLTFILTAPILHWIYQTPTEPPTVSPPTYHELFRPAYHYSCPMNWMNDPNGLTFIDGKYHLYYQYNPYGDTWGNMTWGHARSTDLVHWENLPVAIDMYDNIMIFSGCNIIDVNNTSGLCKEPGCLLAYYTMQTPYNEQEQGIAYSNDNGTSYEQYEGNPIISLGFDDFRDPKVFWYEPDQKWVMVVAVSNHFKLQIYSSKDLINWKLLSEFKGQGSKAGVWEDPDLYELPIDNQGNTRWVLAHSVAVNSVEYYIGEFDGTSFINSETKGEVLYYDYGFDFDEAATWNNEPKGRRLIVAWLDEGEYGGGLPTKGWRGQLTLIRELQIKRFPEGLRVVSKPIDELALLRDVHYSYQNIEVNKKNSNVTLEIHGAQFEIIAEFVLPKNKRIPKEFGIKVFTGKNQTTVIGYNTTSELMFVDRRDSGIINFCRHFAAVSNTTYKIENGTIKFHIFLDKSSVEVFVDDGKIVMTNLIFPDPMQDAIELYAVGGSVTVSSVEAWTLKDIWLNDTAKAGTKEGNSFLTSLNEINT